MRIRSDIDLHDQDLRLIRLADTSDTRLYVEPHSVVRRHKRSGATHRFLVYEVKPAGEEATFFKIYRAGHPRAVATDGNKCLVPYEQHETEEILDDRGTRYAHGQRTATVGR